MKTTNRPNILTTTRHCIVDIETLDTGENGTPAVFEVGLILYNPHAPTQPERVIEATEPRCNPLLAIAAGFAFSADTIEWHYARRSIDQGSNNSLPKLVADVFAILTSWKFDFIWCRGIDFDLPILKALFAHYGHHPLPWKYWQQRDLRTIADLYPGDIPEKPHRALRDALIDAEILGHVIRQHAPKLVGQSESPNGPDTFDIHQISAAHLQR